MGGIYPGSAAHPNLSEFHWSGQVSLPDWRVAAPDQRLHMASGQESCPLACSRISISCLSDGQFGAFGSDQDLTANSNTLSAASLAVLSLCEKLVKSLEKFVQNIIIAESGGEWSLGYVDLARDPRFTIIMLVIVPSREELIRSDYCGRNSKLV